MSVATQDALAATLVQEGTTLLDAGEGATPTGADLLLDAGDFDFLGDAGADDGASDDYDGASCDSDGSPSAPNSELEADV